jgi:hypothetical protein
MFMRHTRGLPGSWFLKCHHLAPPTHRSTISGRANVWHADWNQFLDWWLTEHRTAWDTSAAPASGTQPAKNSKGAKGGKGDDGSQGQKANAAPPTAGQLAARARPGKAAAVEAPVAAKATGAKAKGSKPAVQPAAPTVEAKGAPPKQQAGAKQAAAKPSASSVVLNLDSLRVVRESPLPEAKLESVCAWLAEQRRSNSAFYQSLHAL